MKNNRLIYWLLWGMALVVINTFTVPIAMFSLFGTAEGTSIFSIDYAIFFAIFIGANAVILQLLLSILRRDERLILTGLVIAVAQIIALFYVVTIGSMHGYDLIALLVIVVLAIILLGVEVTKRLKNHHA